MGSCRVPKQGKLSCITPVSLTIFLATSLAYFSPPAAASPGVEAVTAFQNTATSDNASFKQVVSKRKGKYARAVASFVVNAPQERVWSVLADYDNYPKIFHRIYSCQVTKRQGDLVFTEGQLKSQMFVRRARNYAVNDLSGKPNVLRWHLLEGNFKSVIGTWELAPSGAGCLVKYTLEVDTGPVVPTFLASFVLKLVHKEIVSELKEWIESNCVLPPATAGGGQPTADRAGPGGRAG